MIFNLFQFIWTSRTSSFPCNQYTDDRKFLSVGGKFFFYPLSAHFSTTTFSSNKYLELNFHWNLVLFVVSILLFIYLNLLQFSACFFVCTIHIFWLYSCSTAILQFKNRNLIRENRFCYCKICSTALCISQSLDWKLGNKIIKKNCDWN